MQSLILTVTLLALAAVLFLPARRLLGETLASPRPDTKLAAAVNATILAAIFAFVIVNELGTGGIAPAFAGALLGAETGLIVSYFLTRFLFGSR